MFPYRKTPDTHKYDKLWPYGLWLSGIGALTGLYEAAVLV
jgi:hypothetical protein